jgi:tetratricopeptide (TPR) repeat protein
MAHWSLGDYTQTIDLAKQLRLATEGDLRYEHFGFNNNLPSVLSRALLAWCLGEQGAFAEGIAYGEEGLRIAEGADHPDSFVRIAQGIGHLYLCKGETQLALPILERGLAVCQEANIPVILPWLAAELGYAYALSGRVPEAIPLLEQAVQRCRAMKAMSFLSLWVGRLSAVYRLAGRSDAASSHAEQALALARAHQERGHEAWSLWLLGDSMMDRDPAAAERAAAYHRQALALAEELGMHPLQAHCHHGLGRLYSQTGRAEQARAALSTAIDFYRSMEMAFWLPQAEAILAQVMEY